MHPALMASPISKKSRDLVSLHGLVALLFTKVIISEGKIICETFKWVTSIF